MSLFCLFFTTNKNLILNLITVFLQVKWVDNPDKIYVQILTKFLTKCPSGYIKNETRRVNYLQFLTNVP